ncbi:MAG: multidrug ABC transporter ATP-binding protein [Gammaproteobacteria bacterium RIFCSPLOWO2_02_FULL_56_15]|nr:MAG: multidrug ABC transporter ATP-binding protein [Gammaproteobacteria bacterium RIFCSPLOWO2_02_FULL_56_15]
MTPSIVSLSNVSKRYGDTMALDQVNLEIQPGRIVGLIGPNGAGKTTLLKCLLGLAPYEGVIQVLGKDPMKQRQEILKEVCFIADTAILPRWIKVHQTLDYLSGVHPRFNREKAEAFLKETQIKPNKKVKQLSKGMITQLHLALVMAIDASLLVLDEPTLGLDILYRKKFYTSLLNDYFDRERTILVTTHQVEEIEDLLSDLVFIQSGRVVLNQSMERCQANFVELEVDPGQLDRARALGPISERSTLGSSVLLFENIDRSELIGLGRLRIPRIADLFVAKMQQGV